MGRKIKKMQNKRIILTGPSASGKNILRERFVKRGFIPDVSYTTRPQRKDEVDGTDYYFISQKNFLKGIDDNFFYEWTEYRENFYGTGQKQWHHCKIFIMETIGISKIHPEDREDCFIIFINPPQDTRIKRMALERKWVWKEIVKRLDFDKDCFKDFQDYDIMITNADF